MNVLSQINCTFVLMQYLFRIKNMDKYNKFKHLLEYFVSHLEWV